jgi:hypothetical protein
MLSELKHEADDLGIFPRGCFEAEPGEDLSHRGVLGQNFCGQFFQPGVTSEFDEVPHED